MQLLITICARGGSKQIPRKNILPLAGRPLIAYTIGHAFAFARQYPADILLSTEDEEIRGIAETYGLSTTYRRPASLATDDTGKIDVIADALTYQENLLGRTVDYVLDLDVTSPLRTIDDMAEGLRMLHETESALNLFSVNPARRNPYFNMVEGTENGLVRLSKRPEASAVMSRQAAPPVYELNASFYIYKRRFFHEGHRGAIIDHRSLAYVMPHICFDVDEAIDFDFLTYLVQNERLPFRLWTY